MAFNTGIDADLTKIYNGQYGFPFNNGETYTNPNNQTFTFVELTTTRDLNLLPGFPIQDGGGNVDTGQDSSGKVMGVWVGDGKTSCVTTAGGSKKGVWVQSGGLAAGDVWVQINELDGPDGTNAVYSGVSGLLSFTGQGENVLSYRGIDEGGSGYHAVIDAGGPAAVYSTTGTGGALQNASTAIVQGVHQTAANFLVQQTDPGNATSQAILDGYTIGHYLNLGDTSLTAGTGGDVNSITIKLTKAITDPDGNRTGVVGTFQSATDANGDDQTKLFYGSLTNTTSGTGKYSLIDGVGTSGTNATAVSREEDYLDVASASTGLVFYIALLGTTLRLTL